MWKTLYLLLLIPIIVMAMPNKITTLDKCYNTTTVLVTGINRTIDPSVAVLNFTYNPNKQWWEYPCNGTRLPIYINTTEEKKALYDISVRFYINPLRHVAPNLTLPTKDSIYNEQQERMEIYTNIHLSYTPEPMPTLPGMKYTDIGILGIIIIIGLGILAGFGIYVYRMVTKSDDDDAPVRKKETPEDDDIATQKELERLSGLSQRKTYK